MKPRVFLLLVALIVVAGTLGLVVGCGSSSEDTKTTTTPATSEPAETEPAATNPLPNASDIAPQAETQTVPDVVGNGAQTARMMLSENHLTFVIVTEPPGQTLPIDNQSTVVAQDPAAGTVVDSGSEVTITIKKK